MTTAGDRMTTMLAREFRRSGIRVLAITSGSSIVAGLAANELGADLAFAPGFGTLDAPVEPTMILGDFGLRTAASPVGPLSDTFVAVARGLVGVVTTPAQLDARGAANLSRIGGTDEHPKVALPGSRGLPENHDSNCTVWYLFGDHSPRTLVPEVDFVSGPAPTGERRRRMITPLGVFEVSADGWTAVGLWDGVTADQVTDATGFEISGLADAPILEEPTDEELAALEAVDPRRYRDVEFLPKEESGALFGSIAKLEKEKWEAR